MFMRRLDRVADYALLPRHAKSRQLDCRDGIYQRYKKRGSLRRLYGLCNPWVKTCLEHGELSVGCADRDRIISLYWSEKFWLLVDHAQIFAALWVTSCAAADKRFPQSWCVGSQPLLYANLDVSAMSAYAQKALNMTAPVLDDTPDATAGQGPSALSSLLILAPPALFLLLACELFLLREPLLLWLGGGGGRGASRFVPALEKGAVRALLVGFLPWAIHVSRHVLCVEMQAISRWQVTLTCASGKLDASQLVCKYRLGCPPHAPSADLLWGVGYWVAISVLCLGLPCLIVALNRCRAGDNRNPGVGVSGAGSSDRVLGSGFRVES
jgi:hypothetical protein